MYCVPEDHNSTDIQHNSFSLYFVFISSQLILVNVTHCALKHCPRKKGMLLVEYHHRCVPDNIFLSLCKKLGSISSAGLSSLSTFLPVEESDSVLQQLCQPMIQCF